MSQFKKYLQIVNENRDHIYNESNYDLKDFPQVLKDSGKNMLTTNLNLLKEVLEVNLNNMNNVGDVELMGEISRTLMKIQDSFTKEQKKIQREIQSLMNQYYDFYGKS